MPVKHFSSELQSTQRALSRCLAFLRQGGINEIPPAGAAHAPSSAHAISKEDQLERLAQDVAACRLCSLYRTRTHAVLSDGSCHASLMFIGEAPGQEEDRQGKPFVGAAGQLLTRMIEAMGLRRSDVYICNVLKDRPPGNRTPEPDEVTACLPFLLRQIEIVQPRVICLLGSVAAKAILGPNVSIMRIRGQVRSFQSLTSESEISIVPTFHPAYLLRNPAAKKETWADLQLVKRLLDG